MYRKIRIFLKIPSTFSSGAALRLFEQVCASITASPIYLHPTGGDELHQLTSYRIIAKSLIRVRCCKIEYTLLLILVSHGTCGPERRTVVCQVQANCIHSISTPV